MINLTKPKTFSSLLRQLAFAAGAVMIMKDQKI